LTTQVQDDGFHEIQLNGKQLVFLFMAATVVSVVIFLCGVLVGRGVKTERPPSAQTDNGVLEAPAPPPSVAPVQTASTDLNVAPPPVPAEDFTYTKRLEENNKKETLKASAARAPATVPPPPAQTVQPRADAPPAAVPTPKPVATAKSKEPEVPALPAPAPASSSPAPSRGDGYAIQVAALRESGEADTIAKRLVNKGYDAYVLTPPGGTPNVYRVRVGSFKTRRDAEVVASKLQQEEQFKPWITR
jgi:cell division septation protein DedD